jgi:hypothetical protein
LHASDPYKGDCGICSGVQICIGFRPRAPLTLLLCSYRKEFFNQRKLLKTPADSAMIRVCEAKSVKDIVWHNTENTIAGKGDHHVLSYQRNVNGNTAGTNQRCSGAICRCAQLTGVGFDEGQL